MLDLVQEHGALTFLTISFAVKLLLSVFGKKEKPKHAEYVGKISRLVIYPVKSMKGVDVDAASCSQRGLVSSDGNIFDRYIGKTTHIQENKC